MLTIKNATALYDVKSGHYVKTVVSKGRTRYVCSDHQFSAKVHSCALRAEEEEPLPSSCPGNAETPHNHPPPKRLGNELAAFRWRCKLKLDEDPDMEVKDVVAQVYAQWEFDLFLEQPRMVAYMQAGLNTYRNDLLAARIAKAGALARGKKGEEEEEEESSEEREECDRSDYEVFMEVLRKGTAVLGAPIPRGQ